MVRCIILNDETAPYNCSAAENRGLDSRFFHLRASTIYVYVCKNIYIYIFSLASHAQKKTFKSINNFNKSEQAAFEFMKTFI